MQSDDAGSVEGSISVFQAEGDSSALEEGQALNRQLSTEDVAQLVERINAARRANFAALTLKEDLDVSYQRHHTFIRQVSDQFEELGDIDDVFICLLGVVEDKHYTDVLARVSPESYLTDDDRIAIGLFLRLHSKVTSKTLKRLRSKFGHAIDLSDVGRYFANKGANNAQRIPLQEIPELIRDDPDLFDIFKKCYITGPSEYQAAWDEHFPTHATQETTSGSDSSSLTGDEGSGDDEPPGYDQSDELIDDAECLDALLEDFPPLPSPRSRARPRADSPLTTDATWTTAAAAATPSRPSGGAPVVIDLAKDEPETGAAIRVADRASEDSRRGGVAKRRAYASDDYVAAVGASSAAVFIDLTADDESCPLPAAAAASGGVAATGSAAGGLVGSPSPTAKRARRVIVPSVVQPSG